MTASQNAKPKEVVLPLRCKNESAETGITIWSEIKELLTTSLTFTIYHICRQKVELFFEVNKGSFQAIRAALANPLKSLCTEQGALTTVNYQFLLVPT